MLRHESNLSISILIVSIISTLIQYIYMSTSTEPIMIADHLALDFLNTAFGTTNRVEMINNDSEVYQWMIKAGVDVNEISQSTLNYKGELLSDALELRAIANDLIVATKNGTQNDPRKLNTFLAHGCNYYQVHINEEKRWTLKPQRHVLSSKDLLTPIAEAIADLIVNADFSIVRQCECPDCTLWFYDRTKSHQRRWCDMAVCGNRMKAAAFRARKKSELLTIKI